MVKGRLWGSKESDMTEQQQREKRVSLPPCRSEGGLRILGWEWPRHEHSGHFLQDSGEMHG